MPPEEKIGFCTLCRSRCGSISLVHNDRLISVRPATGHPTGKAMCTKGKAAPELVHNPRRVLHPMRRTRPKGDADPGWTRISWDEALDEVAKRLGGIRDESGAQAVAFGVSTPSGTPLCDSIEWVERFIRLFGSPNICYATEICNWHKDYAHRFTFGCGIPTADYANSDLILLWGHNPANVWLSQAAAISEGRSRGAKMIVVDPRCTALAGQAEHWLRVRPGADAALALGLSHIMLAERGFDEGFVRNWTNAPLLVRDDNGLFLRETDLSPQSASAGYVCWSLAENRPVPRNAASGADGKDYALYGSYEINGVACRPAFQHFADACAAYTPEHVESLTWVPADDLRAAARLLMASRKVAYHAWTGIAQSGNASQTERAVATLYALTGCFDVSGGNVLWNRQPANRVNALELLPEAQRNKALGLDTKPLGPPAQGWVSACDLYRAVLEGEPYRVRAFMAFGSNPVVSQGDVARAEQAFAQLEFHVHCDLFETPTSKFADILLPINTPWEREGLRVGFEVSAKAEELIQLRQQMVPAQGESRSDNDVVFDLAVRLGMESEFFGGSLEAGWNHILAPLGLDVETLRRHPEGIYRPLEQSYQKYADRTANGLRGFDTETGLVELYSEKLLRHGYPPVPRYAEPAGDCVDRAAFPYLLTSSKSGYYCHSQHRSLVSLRKRAPFPQIEIHAQTGSAHDIRDGDWVVVSTPAGQARLKAKFNDSLHPRVLVADYGWWQACEDLGQPAYATSGPSSSSFNSLVSADRADPLSGSVPHRSLACGIKLDSQLDPRRRPWPGYRPFRVAHLERECEDVLSITLASADGGLLPDFLPGQHVSTRLANVPPHGEVTRTYSLSGAADDADRSHYRITVKHIPDGVMSAHLSSGLQVGDAVRLQSPSGSFIIPRQTGLPVVLFAGGIGITPFMSYLETLAQGDSTPEVILHYATWNSKTHAFKARLAELGARLPRVTILNYYEQPLVTDRSEFDYQRLGRLTASVVSAELIKRRARFYMCGPTGMMQTLAEGLIERGVPRFDIFKEEFRTPERPVLSEVQAFSVRFARSQCQATWRPSDGSLLEFGEALGIVMPSGCRVGQCESCVLDIIAGNVRHVTAVINSDEGKCFACQAIPSSDLILDI